MRGSLLSNGWVEAFGASPITVVGVLSAHREGAASTHALLNQVLDTEAFDVSPHLARSAPRAPHEHPLPILPRAVQ